VSICKCFETIGLAVAKFAAIAPAVIDSEATEDREDHKDNLPEVNEAIVIRNYPPLAHFFLQPLATSWA
jgi:hypothetical protein